jgi:hypothetical protein
MGQRYRFLLPRTALLLLMVHIPNGIWIRNERSMKVQRVLNPELGHTAIPSRVSRTQAKKVRATLNPQGPVSPCAHMLTTSFDSAGEAPRLHDSCIHAVRSPTSRIPD